MKPRTVRVHIKELVLEGVAPGEGYRVSEELKIELGRLFAEQGVPSSMRKRAHIESIDASMPRTPGRRGKGTEAGRAIYRGFGK
jgi:hypothetical protein